MQPHRPGRRGFSALAAYDTNQACQNQRLLDSNPPMTRSAAELPLARRSSARSPKPASSLFPRVVGVLACGSQKEASVASKTDARSQAEVRFEKAQKTTAEAKAVIEKDLSATRKKTALLRQLRLAKEVAAGITELDKNRPA